MPPGRPAKLKTPPPDREFSISLNSYLARQNEVASSLRSYQHMAHSLLSFASQQVGTASQALAALQENTRALLENNGMDPDDEKLEAFPQLVPVLKMEKSDFPNSLANGIGNMAPIDLASFALKAQKRQKKQRKPKDPNAPQRPQTAFFLFQMANREKFRTDMKAENPDVKPGDVQKRLTETWNQMAPEQQKPYKDKYLAENEAYNKAKLEYEAKNEAEAQPAKTGDTNLAQALAGAVGAVGPAVEDASGDAESSESDESGSSSSEASESESERTPTPPPPKKTKDKKRSKHTTSDRDLSSERKKKRKHDQEDSDAEVPQKRKKSRQGEDQDASKSSKKKKLDSNIDPELSRLDKQQRKDKKAKRKSTQYGDDY